jgi:hypothetical protein
MSFREPFQRYNYREHLLAKTPNAGAHLPPEAEATQERSNCLDCQGGLVYFFQRSGKKLSILKVPTFEFGE